MRVEIETSAFADAAQKAARVAPSKGEAFDKAQGIVLEVDPSQIDRPVTLKATNLYQTFLARLPAVSVSGIAGKWRLPSAVLAPFVAQLPMGAGCTVVLEPIKERMRLTAGKTKANLVTITLDSFPRFGSFDESGLVSVPHFAQSVEQVSWAVDNGDGVLGGVHIDGKVMVACDRAKLAEVKCVVPVDRPITAPLSSLSLAIKRTAEVKMRATAKHLMLMPDADTQATSRLFADEYPSVQGVRDMVVGHTKSVDVSVEGLCDVLKRQMVLCKGDRYPLVRLTFCDGSVAILMDVPELGDMEDEIECSGGALGSDAVWFTPTFLLAALSNAGMPKVKIDYGGPLEPISITDGVGYRCIVMPRRPGAGS